jgi:uncharacterized membrane protein HdeD (DUF308 family)
MINNLLLGAIAMASMLAALFFLRFWRSTHDRFFLFFALSFFLEGINRILMGVSNIGDENQPLYYLIRLISYVLILIALLDKNRPRSK